MSNLLHKFLSHIPSCKFIFKNGDEAPFRPDPTQPNKGVFYTDNPTQVAEMIKEVDSGHPHIYQDPNQITVAPELVDPEAAKKHAWRKEWELEQQATQRTAAEFINAGNYTPQQLNPIGTDQLSEVIGQKKPLTLTPAPVMIPTGQLPGIITPPPASMSLPKILSVTPPPSSN